MQKVSIFLTFSVKDTAVYGIKKTSKITAVINQESLEHTPSLSCQIIEMTLQCSKECEMRNTAEPEFEFKRTEAIRVPGATRDCQMETRSGSAWINGRLS